MVRRLCLLDFRAIFQLSTKKWKNLPTLKRQNQPLHQRYPLSYSNWTPITCLSRNGVERAVWGIARPPITVTWTSLASLTKRNPQLKTKTQTDPTRNCQTIRLQKHSEWRTTRILPMEAASLEPTHKCSRQTICRCYNRFKRKTSKVRIWQACAKVNSRLRKDSYKVSKQLGLSPSLVCVKLPLQK